MLKPFWRRNRDDDKPAVIPPQGPDLARLARLQAQRYAEQYHHLTDNPTAQAAVMTAFREFLNQDAFGETNEDLILRVYLKDVFDRKLNVLASTDSAILTF